MNAQLPSQNCRTRDLSEWSLFVIKRIENSNFVKRRNFNPNVLN